MPNRTRRLRRLAGLLSALLLIGGVLGSWVLIERGAHTATATVMAKRAVTEGLTSGAAPGAYRHQFYLDVRVPLGPAAAGAWHWGFAEEASVSLSVSAGQYDRTQVGDHVVVRYLPWLGGRAWLVTQPVWAILPVPISWSEVLRVSFWALAIAIGWRLFRALAGRGPAVSGHWAGTVLTLMAVVSVLPELPALMTLGHGAPVPAVVRSVARFDERPGSRYLPDQPLLQPYVRVALDVTRPHGAEPVLAVDEIADGHLPGLRPGATVLVTHAPDAPREARIVGASRLFRVANQLPDLGIAAVSLLLLSLAARARGRLPTHGRAESPS